MYIGTIVEDTLNSNCSFLKNEHGLSLYIKYNNKNILFDSGPSDVLISNALKMNLNISDIDYLIISHGHFDHGGGIIPFLEHNHKAKVFMQKYSNRNYYFEDKKEKEFIENMYQKTGQRNLKSLEVHFSCQEKVSFRMNIN